MKVGMHHQPQKRLGLARRFRMAFGRARLEEAPAKRPLAVVAMAFNEPNMLPFWLRHYEREVGLEDCYVIDHGSTDGSTEDLGTNVTRLPRSTFNEEVRAATVSGYCAALLQRYETVLFTDVDELVVADPLIAPTLREYAALPDGPEVVTCLGLDVVHDETTEGPLDPSLPVLAQRAWFWPFPMLCKPTFIRKPYTWEVGFHPRDKEPRFAGLYLLHIAYADMTLVARRQAKRNLSAPVFGGDHHRIEPEAMVSLIRGQIPWARRLDVRLNGCDAERAVQAAVIDNPYERHPAVWRIPSRFQSASSA